MKKIFLYLIPISFFVLACTGSRDISTQNLASLYRSPEQFFHPEFSLFHLNDSLTRIYLKINPEEFLFVRQDDNHYKAKMKVAILKTYSYEANFPLDTFYCSFDFDISEKGRTKILPCEFDHKGIGTYLLRVIVSDENKNYAEDFFVPMEIEGTQVRQFFLLTDSLGEPKFNTYLSDKEKVHLSYRDTIVKRLWCRYYNRDFPLAAPPFSFDSRQGFNYHSDSVFEVNLNDTIGLNFPAEGFYHFQIDTNLRDGLTLYRYQSTFPYITTPLQMLESMRYITSKREYEEMKSNPILRNAVDGFWINRGGNSEKSRLLIRKYYNRVQEANSLFTSFVEGWRTDRGMIYIVFGAPNTVYRSSSTETWIYGTPNSTLALNFMFTRVNNPFSDNDLVLSRSPIYESSWYRAVETWRQGRAYNSIY